MIFTYRRLAESKIILDSLRIVALYFKHPTQSYLAGLYHFDVKFQHTFTEDDFPGLQSYRKLSQTRKIASAG